MCAIHFCRVNTRYTSQASALFGGSPVAAAAADASASSGVFIAVGSKLYRVSSAGDVSAVGSVQDASASMSTVLLSGLVFLTALNRQCGASGECGAGRREGGAKWRWPTWGRGG